MNAWLHLVEILGICATPLGIWMFWRWLRKLEKNDFPPPIENPRSSGDDGFYYFMGYGDGEYDHNCGD